MAKNLGNGKKLPSIREKVTELEKMMENIQMATRMSQMFMMRFNESLQKMDKDVSNMFGMLNDLQYRTLAMVKEGKFDKDSLDKLADGMKIIDFSKASDAEDVSGGFIPGTITTENSTVIITSTTGDTNDAGIFRSRLLVKDAILPDLKEKLVGRVVGDRFTTTINGLDHTVEILGIREKEIKEEEVVNEVEAATPNEEK